jgi:hypothetical protein
MKDSQTLCPTCGGLGAIELHKKFDFQDLYDMYPKKGPGKKRGMKKLETLVKSQKRYDEIKEALVKMLGLNREKQYYPQFDTFINNYEDYLDLPDPSQPKPPKVYTPIVTEPRYEVSQEERSQRKKDIGNLLVSLTKDLDIESNNE